MYQRRHAPLAHLASINVGHDADVAVPLQRNDPLCTRHHMGSQQAVTVIIL